MEIKGISTHLTILQFFERGLARAIGIAAAPPGLRLRQSLTLALRVAYYSAPAKRSQGAGKDGDGLSNAGPVCGECAVGEYGASAAPRTE